MATEVSPEELFAVISDATSQDPSRVEPSAKRLKELFQQAGVYDALHVIAATKTLPLPIRIQASLQFKNEALKNWKSRKLQTPQNRDNIRRRCLTFLDEEDATIADCNKVAVSRIARADFPDAWPSLIDDLLSVIDTNLNQRYIMGVEDPLSLLKLRRALQLLCGVTKEFSSIKMLTGVQTMKKIFDHLHLTVNNYFIKVFERVQISLDPRNFDNPSLCTDLIISHLLFKILVTLTAWIWQQFSRMTEEERQMSGSWLTQVFYNSIQQLQTLVIQRAEIIKLQVALPNSQAFVTHQILTKHIRRFGKFYLRLASVDHKRLAELPNCSDMVMFYWTQIVEAAKNLPKIEDQPAALFPVRFLVQGLVLFKDLLGQWKAQRRDGTPNKNVLNAEFIGEAVKVIVGCLLPFTQADLKSLEDDPEEWVSAEEQENQQWEYELRPCSERVLTQLSNQYPQYVTPLLTEVFMDAVKPGSTVGISHKEALYCAIGRCCQRLKEGDIHFEDWVNQILTAEVQLPPESDPFIFLLKRRIAWVLGKWMYESCCSPNMPAIWQILLHLLSQRGRGSTVIRLTAAVALREGVDTLDFNPEEFSPFLSGAVTELMNLIGAANTFDSKRKVDDGLNVVIDRAGTKIIPLVPLISGPIPALWMEADDDWLFKSSLLVTMTNLVKAIGMESVGLSHIVVPLVQDSMHQGLNLDVDGVNLWKDAMRNTITIDNPNPAASLSSLIPLLVQHLETNLDLLGTLLNIAESYFLLDPARMLQIDAVALLRVFLGIIEGPAIQQNKKDALSALNFLVQLNPSSLWGEAMHASGLFPRLLDVFIMDEEDTQTLCLIEYLFSRIILSDSVMFLQLITAAAPLLRTGKPTESNAAVIPITEAKVYDLFLDRWWGTFDAMSQPRHRKLIAMGTAVLASTGRPEILSRLSSEFFNLWMDVFCEIKEALNPPVNDDEEEVQSVLTLYWEQDSAPASYYQGSEGTPEYERRKVIFEKDPVRTEKLSAFVGARLRQAQEFCGPSFQQYLKDADPTVLEQIRAEVSM